MIGLDPDITLIFDMDPAEALARGVARATSELRFEGLGLAFQERMRATYLDIAAAAPNRCVIVDASGDEATVAGRVDAALAGRF